MPELIKAVPFEAALDRVQERVSPSESLAFRSYAKVPSSVSERFRVEFASEMTGALFTAVIVRLITKLSVSDQSLT